MYEVKINMVKTTQSGLIDFSTDMWGQSIIFKT